jgi:hypothetical protein
MCHKICITPHWTQNKGSLKEWKLFCPRIQRGIQNPQIIGPHQLSERSKTQFPWSFPITTCHFKRMFIQGYQGSKPTIAWKETPQVVEQHTVGIMKNTYVFQTSRDFYVITSTKLFSGGKFVSFAIASHLSNHFVVLWTTLSHLKTHQCCKG